MSLQAMSKQHGPRSALVDTNGHTAGRQGWVAVPWHAGNEPRAWGHSRMLHLRLPGRWQPTGTGPAMSLAAGAVPLGSCGRRGVGRGGWAPGPTVALYTSHSLRPRGRGALGRGFPQRIGFRGRLRGLVY